jgi:hypothetical protein
LDGLLSRPGGHNNVSMVNNFRLDGFSTSLFMDILGGDGAHILLTSFTGFRVSSFSSSLSITVVSIVLDFFSSLFSLFS